MALIYRGPEVWFFLSQAEVDLVVELAQLKGPGRWTVKEIFGEAWEKENRKRRWGRLIKKAVDQDRIPGLAWVGQASNKSMLYEVAAPRELAA